MKNTTRRDSNESVANFQIIKFEANIKLFSRLYLSNVLRNIDIKKFPLALNIPYHIFACDSRK